MQCELGRKLKRYLLFILNGCFLLVLAGIEVRNTLLISEMGISNVEPTPLKILILPDPPLPTVSLIQPTSELVVESEPILMAETIYENRQIVELILDPMNVPILTSVLKVKPKAEIVELMVDPASVPLPVAKWLGPLHGPELEEIAMFDEPINRSLFAPEAPAVVEDAPKVVVVPEALAPVEPQGNQWPLPKRVYLSHVDGVGDQSGISFGTDYATFQMLLAPDYRLGEFMYMVDLRGHRFDNNTFGANVGLGVRYIPELDSFCELLGLNSYYDYREGFIGDYHQMGLGVEVLGRRWDFRANGYIPLGAAKNMNSCHYDYPGGYEIDFSDCEFATYGFNAEVGWLAVKGKEFLLYAATGPYFLTRSSCCFETMRGFEFRLRPQFKDYFAIEGKVSWDNVYEWVYQTQFIVSIPLYAVSKRGSVKRPCGISERQIYQPVERFEVMPLGRRQCWSQNY